MKRSEVKKRVDEIIADPSTEDAHVDDDKLRDEFLEWIASGAKLPTGQVASASYLAGIARELRRTNDMERWYS